MDEILGSPDDGNFEKDSLSNESISNDSLLNDTDKKNSDDDIPIIRKGSYTIEKFPEMSQSTVNYKLRQPLFVKVDNNRHSYASEKSSDVDIKFGSKTSQKNMMTQSMYERPWISAKRNNSIVSSANKQRTEKLRLAKEEQVKKHQQKIIGLNVTQKQADIARKRKEEEIQRKTELKKTKALERQRIVDERKQRLAQAEEARKNRILQKMTNHEERHIPPATNMMTMSCYGAVGSARLRTGNKEVIKDRFSAKRPLSSTGKVIGFGSSSPRIICENPLKPVSKNPPKISDYLMERSQVLSRPTSSRLSDRMITSVFSPSQPANNNRLIVRQGSMREKRTAHSMASPVIDEIDNSKLTQKQKITPKKKDIPDGKPNNLPPPNRSGSRKSGSAQTSKISNSQTKPVRDRPSSAKPIQCNISPPERGMVQSKSSTFPKSKSIRQSVKCKVDVHLDSDSIEDEGITLTESLNHPRSITSSLVSHVKSEVNRTDLSSADSLDTDNMKEKSTESNQPIINVQSKKTDNSTATGSASVRALPTKDLSEAEYKARLTENRRLIREKREKEREQLMKAERERRHADEASVRETLELEKNRMTHSEEPNCTTSNDDAVEDHSKHFETSECELENNGINTLIPVEICVSDPNVEEAKQADDKEKERLERKKKLEAIMSRFKKTNEESSSEGGGVSPRRAMSPELAEIDTEVTPTNPTFRSTLLQSMLNKGKLSAISKTPSPSIKDSEEIKSFQENIFMNSNNNHSTGTLPLTSLRESIEDSESLQNNVNSKSSVAVRSSGIDGNSLSDANSDFVADQDNQSSPSLHCAILNTDREACDGQEEDIGANEESLTGEGVKSNGVSNVADTNNYSSVSSIETEEEEIMKAPYNQDHLYNSHIIRPLAQEGCVFQS